MLELRDVTASYGPVEVLHGVNLRVEEHQLVALVGRNGAGKTTTLRVASGLLGCRGELWFDGRRVDGADAEDLARVGIAHVPEGRGIFPGLTVRENLMCGAYHRKLGRRAMLDQIEYVTATFPRLTERLDQAGGSLSGGEQQMLAVARALMSRPRVLLVDEPSLGLAPVIVEELYDLLVRLSRDGLTLLVVEQYVDLALDVAHYAYVLEKGAVGMEGPARELARDRHLVELYMTG